MYLLFFYAQQINLTKDIANSLCPQCRNFQGLEIVPGSSEMVVINKHCEFLKINLNLVKVQVKMCNFILQNVLILI